MSASFSHYHVHVYCKPSELAKCEHVRTKMTAANLGIMGSGPVRRTAIGPHPLPMFEAWFASEHLQKIMDWIGENRDGLSVMFHPLSGNDLEDHRDYAFWIGEKLSLKLEIFL